MLEDKGWKDFRQEWIDITKEQATAKGVQLVVQDGDPKPTGEAGTLMVVRVSDYKHVSVGARIMFGVMTGNAYIDAKVEFDATSGSLYGERTYNTTSSAWSGVFAAVTLKQLDAIAVKTWRVRSPLTSPPSRRYRAKCGLSSPLGWGSSLPPSTAL